MTEPNLDLAFRMIGEHMAWKVKTSTSPFSRVRETIIRQMDIAFLEFIEEQGLDDKARAEFLGMREHNYRRIRVKLATLKGHAHRRNVDE